MDFYGLLLVVALIVRILLDLASGLRPHYVFDACYAVLFLALGLVAFVMGGYALFGCISIVLAIASSLLGVYRYKKRLRDNHGTIPDSSDTVS